MDVLGGSSERVRGVEACVGGMLLRACCRACRGTTPEAPVGQRTAVKCQLEYSEPWYIADEGRLPKRGRMLWARRVRGAVAVARCGARRNRPAGLRSPV